MLQKAANWAGGRGKPGVTETPAALALHGFAGAASEHPQWGCAEAPSGLEPGGNLPLYIMANFYTDHPEIPAAEEKYFVKKISSETECKQERDLV